MAGLSAPPMISKRPPILMAGRTSNDSRNIANEKATTRRACRPTKSTDFRAIQGRKRKVMVSGARGLENRHHSCISAGTVKRVWNIIMNIPTVRMNPNSASALKLEVASAAVAVAAVTMQKTTLSPVVSKVRNTAVVQRPALRPFLRHSVKEMHDLVVSQSRQDGDKGQADEIYFSRIETRYARSPQNAQAGGQQRQKQQRNSGIDQQAQQQIADDRNQGNPTNIPFDELVILLRVNVSAGRDGPHAGIPEGGLGAHRLDMLPRPLHDLLGELVVHGRLARLGNDEQRLVVFAEESVPISPGQVETGELREPLAVVRRHFHEAQADRRQSNSFRKRRTA